jgi:hypothetical protein
VLADELRRGLIGARLTRSGPTQVDVARFFTDYGTLTARRVEVQPAAPWLGGRTSGLAISSLAPPQVLALAVGATARVRTPGGDFTVRAVGGVTPLASATLEEAAPAIRSALSRVVQDAAYRAWMLKRQTAVRRNGQCVRDDLPAVGIVDLTAYLPFLAL